MSGKRRATTDLNQDNWEREDEPEDAGTFKKASSDELKRRVFKVAKRRRPVCSVSSGEETADVSKKSAFASFMAFSKTSAAAEEAFSFLSNSTSEICASDTRFEKSKEGIKTSEGKRYENLGVQDDEIKKKNGFKDDFISSCNMKTDASKSHISSTGSTSDVSELSELSDSPDISEIPVLN